MDGPNDFCVLIRFEEAERPSLVDFVLVLHSWMLRMNLRSRLCSVPQSNAARDGRDTGTEFKKQENREKATGLVQGVVSIVIYSVSQTTRGWCHQSQRFLFDASPEHLVRFSHFCDDETHVQTMWLLSC